MNPDKSKSAGNRRKFLLIAAIAVVLVIDYMTILRVEIFEEWRNGKPALDAVLEGNLPLTLLGITISVVGVAVILTLLTGNRQ